MQKFKNRADRFFGYASPLEKIIFVVSAMMYVVGLIGMFFVEDLFFMMLLGIIGFFVNVLIARYYLHKSTEALIEAQADLIDTYHRAIDEGKLVWAKKTDS